MKRLFLLFLLALSAVFCRAQLPEFSNRLVNDYAKVLSDDEVRTMETRLRSYYDTTSNCVIVVIINDLAGYEAADYAQRLGEKWGVGTGKYSNGLVILLSPKEHEVFIATGYGLEGVLPDVTCHRIAEKYMKPHFQEEEYYEGLEAGLDVILPVAAKEYSFEEFQKEQDAAEMALLMKFLGFLVGSVLIILLVALIASYRKKHPSKRKLALLAIANAKTKEDLSAALSEAKRLRIKQTKIDESLSQLFNRCVMNVTKARTYRSMVDGMSLALEMGADEQQVQMAREQAVAGIIAAVGSARSVTGLQEAVREAERAGATEFALAQGREKALSGTLSDLSKAVNVKALRSLEDAAISFGAQSVDVQRAKELAGRNALSRISSPKSIDDVTAAIELVEFLGISEVSLSSAKEAGQRSALDDLAKANSNGEIKKASELALFLGAATLAVMAAKKLAQARLRRSSGSFGGGSSFGGGGSFRGGGSSGTFGGFGGGHFGGGGGGAKW